MKMTLMSIGLLCVACLGTTCQAEDVRKGPATILLDFENVPLARVVEHFQHTTGISIQNISLIPHANVTLTSKGRAITREEYIRNFTVLLEMNNVTLRLDGEKFGRVEPKVTRRL